MVWILSILRARSKVGVDAGCNTVRKRNLVADARGLRLKPELFFPTSKVETKQLQPRQARDGEPGVKGGM